MNYSYKERERRLKERAEKDEEYMRRERKSQAKASRQMYDAMGPDHPEPY